MMFTTFVGAGHYSKTAKTGLSNIEGVVTFPGGEFDMLRIDGVCTAEGSIEANSVNINGVFTARRDVYANELDCDGVVTIDGNLRMKKADINGVVTVHGDKVEADFIRCDGVLTAEKQVSADIIEAQGFVNAKEIVGDRIRIGSFRKSSIFKLFMKIKETMTNSDFSKIDLIEATTIELRGVRAKNVNGHDVTIGPACIIDRVDCSGTLSIDETAKVGEVVGSVNPQG